MTDDNGRESDPKPRLFEAVLAVQGELTTLTKDKKARVETQKGTFTYAYSSLDSIVEVVGPILNRHGLVWLTLPSYDERTGDPVLLYRLGLASTGETIGGAMKLLLAKADSQGMGSALTYARRYALCAVLNIVADEDDDGVAASGGAAAAPGSAVVNLQQEAKGLRNEAVNQVFARAGLPAQQRPWAQLGQIPAEKAEHVSELLKQAQAMA